GGGGGGPAPCGFLRVPGARLDRAVHEPGGSPGVPGDEQQVRAPAVGRDVGTEVEHPLVVVGGCLVVAELQRRVAEQAVGAGVSGVELERAPCPFDRLLEIVPGAVDPSETYGGGDVGGVECPGSLEREL